MEELPSNKGTIKKEMYLKHFIFASIDEKTFGLRQTE
jgi:hypothetical protein